MKVVAICLDKNKKGGAHTIKGVYSTNEMEVYLNEKME